MRILVTGGAGFIGSHLVDRFLAEGAEVVVLDDLSTGHESNLPESERLTLMVGSVTDRALVQKAAAGCDHICHLAAMVSVQDSIADPVRSHEVNLNATQTVLEEARKNSAQVVFASSAAVYGESGKTFQSIGEEAVPISPYGIQKLASEYYVSCYASLFGVQAVSFRQFNVYGPRQDPSSPYSGVISIFCRLASEGCDLNVYGDGMQTRDFIYVADVVEAYWRAIQSKALTGGPVNVGTGVSTTINHLAESVVTAIGSSSQVVHKPAKAGDIRHSCADVSGFIESGLAPEGFTPLASGLAKTVDWYRSA